MFQATNDVSGRRQHALAHAQKTDQSILASNWNDFSGRGQEYPSGLGISHPRQPRPQGEPHGRDNAIDDHEERLACRMIRGATRYLRSRRAPQLTFQFVAMKNPGKHLAHCGNHRSEPSVVGFVALTSFLRQRRHHSKTILNSQVLFDRLHMHQRESGFR